MTADKIIELILDRDLEWKRVNDLPCIHTFYREYYINLCQWQSNAVPTISIDVDDIERGYPDIVRLDIQKGQPEFDPISEAYFAARQVAENIAA